MILNVDPKFASPSTGDYHLMQGSPAIDAGDPSAQDSHDFDGTPHPGQRERPGSSRGPLSAC